MTSYLLDANTFIEAKNQYYRFSFFPGYWDWLLAKNRASTIYGILPVYNELRAGNDDLADWAKKNKKMFIGPPGSIEKATTQLSEWATTQDYTMAAQNDFLASADYLLIAYAKIYGYIVVTREVSNPNSKGRVKIPDACMALGVSYISPFDMIDKEKANFVLN